MTGGCNDLHFSGFFTILTDEEDFFIRILIFTCGEQLDLNVRRVLNFKEMNKVILIHKIDAYPIRLNKWISVFSGIIMAVLGLYYIAVNLRVFEPMGFIIGMLFFVSGLSGLFYSLTTFSANSRYALKVKINDEFLEFKSSLFGPRVRIDWKSVKYIAFKQYQVHFYLGKTREIFSYSSTPEVSREIKKTIRDIAARKHIEIYL